MSNDIEECFAAARQFVEARFASYPPEACAVLIAAYVTATGGKVAGKGKKKEAEPMEIEPDQIAQFVRAVCTIDPTEKTRSQVLYQHYLRWARRNGIARPFGMQILSRELNRRGYKRFNGGKYRHLIGLRISDEWEAAHAE